jgi:signal transduction histidine kinase
LAGRNTDVIDRPFVEVFADFKELDSAVFDRIVDSGQQYSARELRIGAQDGGADRYFNLVCQPLRDANGSLILAHAVEVTEQVRARHDVERALHLRDEFLSIASHELKTPIAALQAQAQLVLRRAERGTLEVRSARPTVARVSPHGSRCARATRFRTML